MTSKRLEEIAAEVDAAFDYPESMYGLARDLIEALEAYQWRDISTAPNDGTPIELFCPYAESRVDIDGRSKLDDFRRFQIGWYRGSGVWRTLLDGNVYPTHWRPLPQPPDPQEVTKIQWTEKVWVPVLPKLLGQPLEWRKPALVFVDSDLFHESIPFKYIAAVYAVMAACPLHIFQILTKRPERALEFYRWSELEHPRIFGNLIPNGATYARAGWLSKFISDLDLREHVKSSHLPAWPLPNVWLGVSVEDQQRADERIPILLQCPAAVRWVSAEPLLGPIDFTSANWLDEHIIEPALDWIVVGGESGPRARPCDVGWLRSIIAQCQAAPVPVFVKQLGCKPYEARIGTDAASVDLSYEPDTHWFEICYLPDGSTRYERLLNLKDPKGGDPDEWPEDLRVREYPEA